MVRELVYLSDPWELFRWEPTPGRFYQTGQVVGEESDKSQSNNLPWQSLLRNPIHLCEEMYHLKDPHGGRQSSWKMAGILKFQVAVGGLLSSDPQRLLMAIFMLVSPNKPVYHLTAPLRWWPSWKMAATLKFQLAVGGLLSSDPQRLLMAIVMLVSPNKPLYHLLLH